MWFENIAKEFQLIFNNPESRFSWYFLILTYTTAIIYYFYGRSKNRSSIWNDAFSPRNFFNPSAWVDSVIFTLAVLGVIEIIIGSDPGVVYDFGRNLGKFPHEGIFPGAGDLLIIKIIWPIMRMIAGDLAYYFYHYLMHRYTSLWIFHAVHHSSRRLNLLTAYRMHPVDGFFSNLILGLMGGLFGAITLLLFGKQAINLTIYGFVYYMPLRAVIANLRHSHVWMLFPDWLAVLIMSPAHHQMHHSRHPDHTMINLANDFAFIDRMFGTLYVPTKDGDRELVVGINEEALQMNPGSAMSCMFRPFKNLYLHWMHKYFNGEAPPWVAIEKRQADAS
jgi:sterol desaturase/sphingolipid hydroxylase (fatty acid hydroxylase superfamily)